MESRDINVGKIPPVSLTGSLIVPTNPAVTTRTTKRRKVPRGCSDEKMPTRETFTGTTWRPNYTVSFRVPPSHARAVQESGNGSKSIFFHRYANRVSKRTLLRQKIPFNIEELISYQTSS